MDTFNHILAQIMVAAICVAFYLTPAILAFARRTQSRWGILALNLLLGWSGFGWVGALIWALVAQQIYTISTSIHVRGDESGLVVARRQPDGTLQVITPPRPANG